MRFERVCVESLGFDLPIESVSTGELEHRLAPLYERLRLPEGRLEAMTGIAARRVWPAGTLPSDRSIVSGRHAIEAAGVDPVHIGALVHASVCRDRLEPATACRVHHALGLPAECVIYDVSNACLGLLNGIVQVATMIEIGQIRAGLVLGTEDSRPLMETTVDRLNRDTSFTRRNVKPAIASLTIGSASCAVLLVHADLSQTGNHLVAAAVRAETEHHLLCRSGRDETVADGMRPWMETDSEALMRQGIAAGRRTFSSLLEAIGWQPDQIDRTVCHQVGTTHRRQMLESLGLDSSCDFITYPWLGNTGSVALPVTLSVAGLRGLIPADQRLALLGIGSGINCLMLGTVWQQSRVGCDRQVAASLPAEEKGVRPRCLPANNEA